MDAKLRCWIIACSLLPAVGCGPDRDLEAKQKKLVDIQLKQIHDAQMEDERQHMVAVGESAESEQDKKAFELHRLKAYLASGAISQKEFDDDVAKDGLEPEPQFQLPGEAGQRPNESTADWLKRMAEAGKKSK